jgi:16S rRNA C1402 N4-methylase RsmH
MTKPHILLAQSYWRNHVRAGDLAIDMTCGNGHDTHFLAELQAEVIAFDIQKNAIENTKALVPQATILHRSHDELSQIVLPTAPRLIVYNLGYLPGGDKSKTTTTATTLSSLKQALEKLAPDGAISIMCYPGHEEGLEEEKAVVEFTKTLDKKRWSVSFHQWINQEKAPSLIWVSARN